MRLGSEEGNSVGESEGLMEGCFVGENDGSMDGARVGSCDGSSEGANRNAAQIQLSNVHKATNAKLVSKKAIQKVRIRGTLHRYPRKAPA